MKDVKKMLKTQAKDALPDASVKERVRTELGYTQNTAQEAAYAHGGTRAVNKKGLYSLLAAALALVIALCVLLPVLLTGGGGTTVLPPALSAAGDFYAYSAASAGALLSQSAAQAGTASLRRTLTAEEQDRIRQATDEYLRLAEGLLAEDSITHEAVAVPEEYAQYRYAMTITAHGLAGDTVTYTMYYSEALSSEETEENESERAYDITGVLVTESGAYPVRGGRLTEEENEGGETESESELWFEAYTGENSYIRIEQEAEEESEGSETETERTHRLFVYENGTLTESTTIDYEEENGEAEIALTILRGGQRDTLEFRRETRGGTEVLFVEADIGGLQAQMRVYPEEDGYRYEFMEEDDD